MCSSYSLRADSLPAIIFSAERFNMLNYLALEYNVKRGKVMVKELFKFLKGLDPYANKI